MRSISKLNLLGLSFAGFGLAAAANAVPLGSAMVGGLLQADFVSFAGDKDDVSRTSGDIRRANIWIKGDLTDEWSYQLGYDARYTRLDTSWIGYGGFDPFWLAMGLIDAPQSLDYWSGPANSTFMEYASVVQAFQPYRGIGLYLDGAAMQEMIGYQAALYVPNFETADVLADGYADAQGISTTDFGSESDAIGVAGRLTLNQQDTFGLDDTLHFGLSIRYEGVSSSQALNPYVTTPNMLGKVSGGRNNVLLASVTPSAGDAKGVTYYGAELAGIFDSLTLQGEYMKTHVNGRDGNSNLSFSGYYVQAAYVVTGEKRAYDKYSGTIGSVESINNPYGAWELAFRFGYVDLSDNPSVGYDTVLADKRGTQKDYTLGVNWYVTDNVRFMADYSVAQADYSHATDRSDANVKAIGVRTQVGF